MSRPERRVSLGQAVALGLLHGPAELLPISSSGHLGAIPWLLGSSYAELEAQRRKSFEVALHAGTAAALICSRSRERLDPHAVWLIVLGSAPAGLAGLALEDTIAEHMGTPATIVAGLVAGSVAMAVADRRSGKRRLGEARACDAVCLGLAQAAALAPGVSRQGATLAAARWRGFTRADAYRFSSLLRLPPIVGAAGLRLAGHRRHIETAFLAGAASTFASTLASERFVSRTVEHPLWPFAAYRIGLAGAILARLRRGSTTDRRRQTRP